MKVWNKVANLTGASGQLWGKVKVGKHLDWPQTKVDRLIKVLNRMIFVGGVTEWTLTGGNRQIESTVKASYTVCLMLIYWYRTKKLVVLVNVRMKHRGKNIILCVLFWFFLFMTTLDICKVYKTDSMEVSKIMNYFV